MKANAADFVGLLFSARDYAHTEHLNTDSYAQHMALGSFYDEIVDLADSFAETWMGRKQEKIGEIEVPKAPRGNCLAVMNRYLEVVQDTRDFVQDDTVLSNIADEIEQLFSSTIYKLKFLK